MNILVTGANGQLGNEMRLVSSHSDDRYIFTDISMSGNTDTIYLDITDRSSVYKVVHDYDIDAIVNCAAYNDVPKAEEQKQLCELINVTAPENLAYAMRDKGGLLVHISSDYVFGGGLYNTPRTEEHCCTPTGVYGNSKLLGEQVVQKTGCKHVIIRTAWLYSEFGKNFCKTMMSLTATKPELKVVFDQVGTPTYALDLAKAILVILKDYAYFVISTEPQRVEKSFYPNSGIYHYSNEGVCSWYDFTKMIAEYNGTTACDILPCHSDEFPSPVTRPSYSVLDKTKIKETFGIKIPYWTESLKKCIANLRGEK